MKYRKIQIKDFFITFAGGPLNGLTGSAKLMFQDNEAFVNIWKFNHKTVQFADYLRKDFKVVLVYKTKQWARLCRYSCSMVSLEFFRAINDWYMLETAGEDMRVVRAIHVGDNALRMELATAAFCEIPALSL